MNTIITRIIIGHILAEERWNRSLGLATAVYQAIIVKGNESLLCGEPAR